LVDEVIKSDSITTAAAATGKYLLMEPMTAIIFLVS